MPAATPLPAFDETSEFEFIFDAEPNAIIFVDSIAAGTVSSR